MVDCVSSDDINLLIQHYLQEFGFNHSSFAFGCESKIPQNSELANKKIPPGSLVYLIQKGSIYKHMENMAYELEKTDTELSFSDQIHKMREYLTKSEALIEELCDANSKTRVYPFNIQNTSKETSNTILSLSSLSSEDSEGNLFLLDSNSSLILSGHTGPILNASFSPDSSFLASISADGSLGFWKLLYSKFGHSFVSDSSFLVRPFDSEGLQVPKDILSLSWKFDGTQIAFGSFTGSIAIFSQPFQECSFYLSFHKSPILELSFSKTGYLLSCDASGLCIISSSTDKLCHFNVDPNIMGAGWLSDNIAIVASNKSIIQCDISNQFKVVPIIENNESISCLSFGNSKRIRYAAFGDVNGNVKVFDSNGSIVFEGTHKGCVTSVQFGRIPFSLISGSSDGSLKRWNYMNKQLIHEYHNEGCVFTLAFDPMVRYIVCNSSRNVINVWNLENEQLAFGYVTECRVLSLNFSPNGKFLAICLENGKISFIDFECLC